MKEFIKDQREQWLDIARGLGIIFVMIGHTQMYTASFLVYIFHMPMFFFISGYFFSGDHYDGKTFFVKKVKRLLIPYYILGIVIYFATFIQKLADVGFLFSRFNGKKMIGLFLDYVIQDRFGTVWYIACLFWMTCIFYLLLKWTKHNLKKMWFISFIMILIAALYYALGGGSLPGNIDIVFTMMIFYLAGYSAKQKAFFQKEKLQNRLGLWTVLSFVIALAAGLLNLMLAGKKVDIYFNDYGFMPLMYLGSFAGLLGVLYLSQKIHSRFLEFVGKYSMLFYAWHQAIIFPLTEWALYELGLFQGDSLSARVGSGVLSIVLSIAVLWIPTVWMKSYKWSRWFGL